MPEPQESPPVPATDEPFTIHFDESCGMVRVFMQGFWTVELAHRFSAEYKRIAQRCRPRFGRLKFLVDARTLPIQPLEVGALLIEQSPYEAGDRTAIIVDTVMAKMGSRRYMQNYSDDIAREVFNTIEEAEAWLNADR